MDVCVDLLLPKLQPMADLRHEQRHFTWEGTSYPQEPDLYRWGRHLELRKHAQPPAYVLARLPAGLYQPDWEYFVLGGDGLDLLAREVNGEEVDWEGHSLEDFLLEQLGHHARWALVYSLQCDQVDLTREVDASGLVVLLKEQLNWNRKPLGFAAWNGGPLPGP
ncbi:hypothetical protein P2318_00635 [Myxococcaceae bacterium GXIMD 01537]